MASFSHFKNWERDASINALMQNVAPSPVVFLKKEGLILPPPFWGENSWSSLAHTLSSPLHHHAHLLHISVCVHVPVQLCAPRCPCGYEFLVFMLLIFLVFECSWSCSRVDVVELTDFIIWGLSAWYHDQCSMLVFCWSSRWCGCIWWMWSLCYTIFFPYYKTLPFFIPSLVLELKFYSKHTFISGMPMHLSLS